MRTEIQELNWRSPELLLIRPDAFPTFYPPNVINLELERAIRRIGGGSIKRAYGYGSGFSRVAAKDSLLDILLVVDNSWCFYDGAATSGIVKLGTTRNAGFHALWSYEKTNFHLGTVMLDGSPQGIKIAVISLGELSKHARGGRPNTEGKGMLYLAGRLQKASLPIIFDDTTPEQQKDIDQAINQARIDGVLLAEALLPQYFSYRQLAEKYVDLSYIADKRVEKANKSLSLLDKNEDDYYRMLDPILRCFIEYGFIRPLNGEHNVYEKRMSLTEEDVKERLKASASHAFWVNFAQNIWTMGPLNGLLYGLAKFRRARG